MVDAALGKGRDADDQPQDWPQALREHSLDHQEIVEFLHMPGPALKPGDIEGGAANQIGVVRLKRQQDFPIERGNLSTLHDGAVPGAVANKAEPPGIAAN